MYNNNQDIPMGIAVGHDGTDFSQNTIGQARGAHFIHGQLKKIENYPNRARVIASIMSPSGRINFYRQPKIKPHTLAPFLGIGARELEPINDPE